MSSNSEKSKKPSVQKYNLNEVEDIWSTLLSDDESDQGDELFEGESLLYGDADPETGTGNDLVEFADEQFAEDDFDHGGVSGDILDVSEALDIDGGQGEDEEFLEKSPADESLEEVPVQEIPAGISPEAEEFAAVLMFVDGMQQTVAKARLFAPREDAVLLIDEDTGDELIISFDQLACIKISGLPAGMSDNQKKTATREIIKTADGMAHDVLVGSMSEIADLLVCFSMEDQAEFPVILFPKSNINDRKQNRQLTDILLEKRFISHTILKTVLQEFEQLKGMPVEKIIAQRARIPLAQIEEALENAEKNGMLGMQPAEILLISGLVDEEQILDALAYHENISDLTFDQFLVERRIVQEPEMYSALAEMHQIPFVDLRQRKIPRDSLTLLPQSMIAGYEILPLIKKDNVLLVASHKVDISGLTEAIAKVADCKQVKHVLSPPSQIRKIIKMVHAH